jgi:hypothetical protein
MGGHGASGDREGEAVGGVRAGVTELSVVLRVPTTCVKSLPAFLRWPWRAAMGFCRVRSRGVLTGVQLLRQRRLNPRKIRRPSLVLCRTMKW